MTLARLLLVGAAFGCLAAQGCSSARRLAPFSAALAPCTAVTVLDYADRISNLPPGELEEEYRASQKAFSEEGGACERFRLAVVLLTPEARFRDDARALKLLGDYLDTTPASSGGFRPLAKLLVAGTRKERELEGRTRELTRKIADEKTRADTLKHQLDELKEIERIMNERQKR